MKSATEEIVVEGVLVMIVGIVGMLLNVIRITVNLKILQSKLKGILKALGEINILKINQKNDCIFLVLPILPA